MQPEPGIDEEDQFSLGFEEDEVLAPGPDERDMDLMDGTWEQRYYSRQGGSRDWNSIGLAIALLVILAMLLPTVLFITQ